MTPYELNIHIEEYYRNLKEQQTFEMMMTYAGAKLPLLKKFPQTFEKAFGIKQEQAKKQQTDEEMLNAIIALNAAMGGKVVYKTNEEWGGE